MLYYKDYFITVSEVPDEIALAFTITGCKLRCVDCHSRELWEEHGTKLTVEKLKQLMLQNQGISCVLFLGGEHKYEDLINLAYYVKEQSNNLLLHPLKTALYTGLNLENANRVFSTSINCFDYLKVGPYIKALGGLSNKTTNQRMYRGNDLITYKFWRGDND